MPVFNIAPGVALDLVHLMLSPYLLAGARFILGAVAGTFNDAPFQLLFLGGLGAFLWVRVPKDWSLK